MRTTLRLLFFVLICCMGIAPALAQHTLSGQVTTADGKPLAGVIVEVTRGEESVAFGNSKRDGIYSLTIPKEHARRQLTISFRKMNFNNQEFTLHAGATSLSTIMYPGSETLREVIVKASPVMQVGDTLRFLMGSFATAADVTLEDGLKRIPGISVSKSGAISYMGRDISQFYIEGLDLLGGRYNLATRNIPIDKVTGVEVLRRHQHNKVDKNELSSNVALNIRLSEKAKIKPFGTYEVRAGLADESKALYGASGTGMLFRKEFQILGTLKLSNDCRMGADELNSHYGTSSWQQSAESVLPQLRGSSPPFMPWRYEERTHEMASINALQKLTEDNQLKANADYTHERNNHGYEVITYFPMGDTIGSTHERLDYMRQSHKVTADVEYRSNKEQRLFENKLSLYGRFADAEGIAAVGSEEYDQQQRQQTVGVRNATEYVRKVGDWKLRFNSDVQYAEAPEGELDIRLGGNSIALQTARSSGFKLQEKFYTGYQVLPVLAIGLPATFTLNTNRLSTALQGNDETRNDLGGWDMTGSIAPRIDYQRSDRKLRLCLDVPVKYLVNDYTNLLTGQQMNFTKLYADASLYFHWVLSGKANIDGRSDWWHTYGDYFSLLAAPVQTDYRTRQIRSGLFGSNRTSRTRVAYEWQSPLDFWFFNTSVSYTLRLSDIIRGQDVTDDGFSLTEHVGDNRSDYTYLDAKLSKYLLSAKTHLTVGGHYTWSHSQMVSSGTPTSIHGNGYGGYFEVHSNPFKPIDATYRISHSLTTQQTHAGSSRCSDLEQRLTLTWLPTEILNFRCSGEWMQATLADGNNRQSLLVDARAEYKLPKKKIRLRLDANNLLNKRSYHYTVYSGLNAYTYNYRLRGREVVLAMILTP